MRSPRRALLAALPSLVLLVPASAAAEDAPAARASADGFGVASADERFALMFGGYVQTDARFFLDDPDDAGVDTFLVRRARPILEGTAFGLVSFRFMPDFGNGQTVIQDAHADLKPGKELRLRFGKFKAPFGLERLLSGASLLFIERALPTGLAPNRDVGAMLYGELWGGRLGYALAAMNGVPDGASADSDRADGKDLVARLYARPLRDAALPILEGLELGVAATVGEQTGTAAAPGLAGYRTSGGQLGFFETLSDDTPEGTVVADGPRWRVTGHGTWHFNRVGLLGEYVRASHQVRLGERARQLQHSSWQVAATLLLTCDEASFEGVEPRAPIDPARWHFGAIELAARVASLEVDRDAFPDFASPSESARRATSLGFGVNWYLDAAFKAQVGFERTTFDGGAQAGADRPAELVLTTRVQARY